LAVGKSVKSVISPTLLTDSLYRHRPTTDMSVRFWSVKSVWAGPKSCIGPISWAEILYFLGLLTYLGLVLVANLIVNFIRPNLNFNRSN
jgi:hypothetical protein